MTTKNRLPVPADPDQAPVAIDISTDRVEAFTDGVLSIAITLLVLNLEVGPTDDLAHTLAEMWTSYVAYVVSFLLLGVIWMNHHLMFHYIQRTDRVLLVLNLLLLMSVAVLPWAAKILAEAMHTGEGKNLAAVIYGATLVVGGIFFNAIWYYASLNHRHLGAHITPEQAAVIRRRFSVGPLLYLVAAIVGLFSAEVSLLLYGLLLLAYMFEAGAASRQEAVAADAAARSAEDERSSVHLM
jgi:uncharacterized membrane protein